jgi:hypothetical protein
MDKPYVMAVNSANLFLNDKGENPARPDFSGEANVDGVIYRVSLWKKTAKSGKTYLSLSFQKKDSAPPAKAARPAAKAVNDEPFHDDPLPF